MIERINLLTGDDLMLEARWDSPGRASASVIFCHPHPTQGGTMMAPLMVAVTTRLNENGFAVLRFNFRGTAGSEGTHDSGEGEMLDIDSAMEEARSRQLPVALAGWSFGAAMALRWMALREISAPYAGIAPPPSLLPANPPAGQRRFILGRREQVIDADKLMEYAAIHSIDVVLTSGDHFFHGRGKRIGDLVSQGLHD